MPPIGGFIYSCPFDIESMTVTQPQRSIKRGPVVMTASIDNWIATGLMPYATEPEPAHLGRLYRVHFIQVALDSHLSGSWGQTCAEDVALNDDVFNSSEPGGRLLSTWHHSGFPKVWVITDGYGTEHQNTCVMFPEDY